MTTEDAMKDLIATRQRLRDKQNQNQKRHFHWAKDDLARIQIIDRTMVNTINGAAPLYTALYDVGNIHEGDREGAPTRTGTTFRFWPPKVFENAVREQGISYQDVLVVDCLGRTPRTNYIDFNIEIIRATKRSVPILAPDPHDDTIADARQAAQEHHESRHG